MKRLARRSTRAAYFVAIAAGAVVVAAAGALAGSGAGAGAGAVRTLPASPSLCRADGWCNGARFVDLIPAWTVSPLKSRVEVYAGGSCKPCLLSNASVMWLDEGGWRVALGDPFAGGGPGGVAIVDGAPIVLLDGRWQSLRGRPVKAPPMGVVATPVDGNGREEDDGGPRGEAFEVGAVSLRVPVAGGRAVWIAGGVDRLR